ncbi:MAG TPA: hypothetical protein VKA95_04565, partial [Nitrososphaeraceae archaeon]|nr:hypothetical protein [Nitrososphaeraceae archaeon]
MQRYEETAEVAVLPLPTLERQIDEITAGLAPVYAKNLRTISEVNIETIARYINAIRTETSFSNNYRRDIIEALTRLAKFIENINFQDLTREHIVAFLDSYRKPEQVDPLHKWIGTYNVYRMHMLRFFKWLYFPAISAGMRQKPPVVDNIPGLRRRETSIYKPTDLWSPADDLLFLKYCPSKRDK